MNTRGQGYSLTCDQDSHSTAISNISSEATGPIVTKSNEELSGADEIKAWSNGPDHLTNMAAMLVYSINLQKYYSLEPIDLWP